MATIAEIRQQYPQYNDLSDTQLADSFHSKFYADIPKDQFYSQLGIKEKAPAPEVSTMERMFGAGSPIARTLKGAVVDPALAVNQMLANTGLFGQGVKTGANQLVRNVEEATTAGRERVGSTGFDPYQLLGGVVSPVNKLVGLAQAPAMAAKGIIPAVTRSASTGAALAALQPVAAADADFASKKLEQVATGAVLGPLIEGGVKGVGTLVDKLKGLTASGRSDYMQKSLNELAGPDRQKVITALQDAQELVKGSRPTAAEAVSNIPSAVELMAAQKKLSSQSGVAGKFVERSSEQQAARVRSLQDIAGTEAERAAVSAERASVTGPMREGALDINEIARTTLGNIDKQANTTAGRLIQQVKEGLPTLQQTSPSFKLSTEDLMAASKDVAYSLKKAQLDSLEQNGVFPLLATDITKQIDKALKGTTSDTSKAMLQAVKDKIISKTDENGIIGSRDLYENVRKMSNQDIAKLLGLGDQYASGGIPEQAAKALGNVKKFVDSSLDKSTEGLWTKYLTSYSSYSNKLNRMEIGDYLSKKLQAPFEKERAGAFATAVENAAGTIKKSTGIPRYEKLSDVLTSNEVGAVNSVLADLKRSSKAEELARKVGTQEGELPNLAAEIPNFLSKVVTLGRAAIEHLQRGNAKEFNNKMAELMLDPAAMVQFMTSGVKQGKLNELVSSMMKMMDDPTKAAFIQSFTVPAAAQEVGR